MTFGANQDRYRLMQRGGGEVARAVRSFEEDGLQYCDVVNPDSAKMWNRCPVLDTIGVPIGAPSAKWDGTRPLTDYPLVVVLYLAELRTPIVIGKLRNENLQYTTTSNTNAVVAPESPPASEPPRPTDPPRVRDLVVALGGSKLVLRENGTASLVAKGNLDIRSADGVMSLASSEGAHANTDERYVLEGPLFDQLTLLITSINQLNVAVQALQVWAAATGSPAPESPVALAVPAPVLTTTEVGPVDRPALQSAMLRVSSKSMKQV